VTLTPYPF